jgi:hypothetical protein
MKTFTRHNVKAWMRRNVNSHIDDCGEVNMTSLAEDAAAVFGQNHVESLTPFKGCLILVSRDNT